MLLLTQVVQFLTLANLVIFHTAIVEKAEARQISGRSD